MSEKPSDIVSDAEIERVHGNANFGSMSRRQVVNEGVMKHAFGFASGYTQMTILREHGLLKVPRKMSYHADLTQKGKRYLKAMTAGGFAKILDYVCAKESGHD